MEEIERERLIDLTRQALSINEKLVAQEKKFIDAVAKSDDIDSLKQLNEQLNDLCLQEHLTLAASKSLLKIISNKHNAKNNV